MVVRFLLKEWLMITDTIPKLQYPQGIYGQEDMYPMLIWFLAGLDAQVGNAVQYSSQSGVATYASAVQADIKALARGVPPPIASMWTPYPQPAPTATPPDTTGWELVDLDIVDAMTRSYDRALTEWGIYMQQVSHPQIPEFQLSELELEGVVKAFWDSVIVQYQGIPNISDVWAWWVMFYLRSARTMLDISAQHHIWYAKGVQLDALGNLLGQNRYVSFTIPPDDTPYSVLDDDSFRAFLIILLISKQNNFSYEGLDEGLERVFGSVIKISSNQDMSINYDVEAEADSPLGRAIYALRSKDLLPAPMGVGVGLASITPDARPFFASTNSADVALSTSLGWGLCGTSNSAQGRVLYNGLFL